MSMLPVLQPAPAPRPRITVSETNNLEYKAWRMSNIYQVVDKEGRVVLFKPNEAQAKLYNELHALNVILKARQLGFCLDPSTRVLTADLKWIPMYQLVPGQEIVSVDENPTGGRGSSRSMRTGSVVAVCRVIRSAYKVSFDDGRSVICTGQHPWLSRNVATDWQWRSIEAVSKKKLRVGSKVRWITKPWDDPDFNDGWFGGILDGEGSLAGPRRQGGSVCASQLEGPVFDRMVEYCNSRGYNYRIEEDHQPERPSKFGKNPVPKIVISRMDEMFRVIGQTRPARFIGKHWWDGKWLPGRSVGALGYSTITSIDPVGTREMIDLQATTGTYIAEGFVSHNTTFVLLYFLDETLFHPNVEAGVVAHSKPDAQDIFRRKIQFPYEHLPADLKESRKLVTDSKSQMAFSNGSVITVAMTLRSATVQYLLISELGRIAVKNPEQAREIMTGAMEAMGRNDTLGVVESTAKGKGGRFYELCDQAMRLQQAGAKLTKMDYRFHFAAWFECSDYAIKDAVEITRKMAEYFAGVELWWAKHGCIVKLTADQKAWYIKKHAVLGEDMEAEYPSTPGEAWSSGIEGTYFKTQFVKAREEKRITRVPWQDGTCVDCWWDLGMGDDTTIWFTQDVGREIHIINYYSNSGEGLEFYRGILDELTKSRGYRYGRVMGPHDLSVRELGTGVSRLETARTMGMNMEVCPRVEHKADAIQKARSLFSVCWFDEENCSEGLDLLEEYRKEWDDLRGVWKEQPLHNEASHAADAFMTLAVGHGWNPTVYTSASVPARRVVVGSSRGWAR